MEILTIVWDRMPGNVWLNIYRGDKLIGRKAYGGNPTCELVVRYLVEIGLIKSGETVQHKEGKDPYKIGPSFDQVSTSAQ